MSIKDVQAFVLKQIIELADSDMSVDELGQAALRAKMTTLLADSYVSAVKTELAAIRLFADTGYLPVAVEPPMHERIAFDGKPR